MAISETLTKLYQDYFQTDNGNENGSLKSAKVAVTKRAFCIRHGVITTISPFLARMISPIELQRVIGTDWSLPPISPSVADPNGYLASLLKLQNAQQLQKELSLILSQAPNSGMGQQVQSGYPTITSNPYPSYYPPMQPLNSPPYPGIGYSGHSAGSIQWTPGLVVANTQVGNAMMGLQQIYESMIVSPDSTDGSGQITNPQITESPSSSAIGVRIGPQQNMLPTA